MLACACTLYNVLGSVLCSRKSTISCNMVFSGLLLCIVGCFISALITYSPLRQSVNMCTGSLEYSSFFISKVVCTASNSALKLFCRPGSLTASSKQSEIRKNKEDMSNVWLGMIWQ